MSELQRLSPEAPELHGKVDAQKLDNIHYPMIILAGKCDKCNTYSVKQLVGKQASIFKRNRGFTMWHGCDSCGNKFMLGVNDNTFLVHDSTPGEFMFEKRTLKEVMADKQADGTNRLFGGS